MDTQAQDVIATTTTTDSLEPLTAGQILSAARIQQGLSVADVAGRIKFAPRQVEALEADDFERLPELAFVRGFVRSYARLLHLDEATLLKVLPQTGQQTDFQKNATEVPFPTAQSARRVNVLWLSAALGLAVILGIGILFFHDKPVAKKLPEAKPVQDTPIVVPEMPASSVAASSPVVSAIPATTLLAVSAPVVAASAIIPTARSISIASPLPAVSKALAVPIAAKAPLVAPVSAVVAASKVPAKIENKAPIHLVFHSESWVDIKDKSGRTVFKQVNKPGSEQWINGSPPFSVVIGNSSGVRLYYEGEEVELKEFTDIEVARLTLE